jgi:hypothetical protein
MSSPTAMYSSPKAMHRKGALLVAEDVGTQSGKSMLCTLANRLGAETGALWALVIQAP